MVSFQWFGLDSLILTSMTSLMSSTSGAASAAHAEPACNRDLIGFVDGTECS